MRRADRLFQIIQILRRSSRPVTAGEIAAELEVSSRTVYRDVADLIAKITRVVPERLRPFIADPSIGTRPPRVRAPDSIELSRVRTAIREGRKIRIDYRDERGERTIRTIWPVIVGFLEETRMLAAWCEMRQDFRHFRTDRIVMAEFLDERHSRRPGVLRQQWKRHMTERNAARAADPATR
jgi:predicted DNA-binding transcriptional regulator YafY